MDVVLLSFIHSYAGPIGAVAFMIVIALVIYRGEIKAFLSDRRRKREDVQPDADPKELLRATIKKTVKETRSISPKDCREKMMLDLMDIRYSVFNEKLEMVEKWAVEEWTKTSLYSAILSVIYDSIAEAEDKAKREGIHPVVVTVVRMTTDSAAKAFMASVKAVCDSSAINSNVDRMTLLYRVLNETIRDTGEKADAMLAEFDDELEGFEYKGFKCDRRRRRRANGLSAS